MKQKTGLAGAFKKAWRNLSSVRNNRGGNILEAFGGAWQRNIEYGQDQITSYPPVFSCMSLIAGDVAKLPLRAIGLIQGVWQEVSVPAIDKLLARPNPYQNRIQFIENWILSKLSTGNTFVLIERTGNDVTALRILDPNMVQVKVSDSGDVFYELAADNITGIMESVLVPASEIIHDRFNCLYHPLMGISPLWACAIAAGQGLAIQAQSTSHFENGMYASGILSAVGSIGDDTAARLKAHWEANYTGDKGKGKIAVLGDGLKFDRMAMTSADSQLIEQLRWTAEMVCTAFHVPLFMVNIGSPPAYGNVQAVNQQYYTQCLQKLLEDLELCLDQGLNLDAQTGVEFDVKALLRMDSMTQMEVLSKGTGSGLLKIDEGRHELGLTPVAGGNTPYLQQQNYSLEALAKRDARPDLWDKPVKATTPATTDDDGDELPPAKKRAGSKRTTPGELRAMIDNSIRKAK